MGLTFLSFHISTGCNSIVLQIPKSLTLFVRLCFHSSDQQNLVKAFIYLPTTAKRNNTPYTMEKAATFSTDEIGTLPWPLADVQPLWSSESLGCVEQFWLDIFTFRVLSVFSIKECLPSRLCQLPPWKPNYLKTIPM